MRLVASPCNTGARQETFQSAVLDAAAEAGVPVDEREDMAFDRVIDRLPASVGNSLDVLLGPEPSSLEGSLLIFEGDRPVFPWRTEYYLEPFYGIGVSENVLGVLGEVSTAASLFDFVKRASERVCDEYLSESQMTLTSYGTIHSEQLADVVSEMLKKHLEDDRKSLGIVTGWGGPRRIREIEQKINPKAIMSEGGTVLHHREHDYKPEPLFVSNEGPQTRRQLGAMDGVYDHRALSRTRAVWSHTLDAIWANVKTDKLALRSQGSQYSVCVYPNPPESVRKDLPDQPDTAPETVQALQGKLAEEPLLPNDVGLRPLDGAKHVGRIDGTRDGRYVLEKLQATHRTFAPYQILSVDDETIVFELGEPEADLEPIESGDVGISADEISDIAGEAKNSLEADSDPVTAGAENYVVGQSNSVDVFVKLKTDSYEKFRERIGITDVDRVDYFSRGNQQNNDFLEHIVETEPDDTVETVAPANVPDAVTTNVDHVVSGNDITHVIPRFWGESFEL